MGGILSGDYSNCWFDT